jgi:metal-responsive CopG/Arc/MetJ family transcriptional regulator
MRTIQMTLDDDLVKAVDIVSKELHTSRSAFARKALKDALSRHRLEQLEQKHRRGYEQHPVVDDEFAIWEAEQAWGDE